MLEDTSVFRIDANKYRVEPYKFKVYTSLSKALVYARFYIATWDEYTPELHADWMHHIRTQRLPLAFILYGVPDEWAHRHAQLMTLYEATQQKHIPFIYRRKGNEREVRDELYYQLFSYFGGEVTKLTQGTM